MICTKGDATVSVAKSINPDLVKGKTVIVISNPLDFSKGMPPFLIPELTNSNSLGEEVQKILPLANVVKTLDTVNCQIMVNPNKLSGQQTMFISGNNSEAKKTVGELLEKFGWSEIIDLGDITGARSTEMMMSIWIRIMVTTITFNSGLKSYGNGRDMS